MTTTVIVAAEVDFDALVVFATVIAGAFIISGRRCGFAAREDAPARGERCARAATRPRAVRFTRRPSTLPRGSGCGSDAAYCICPIRAPAQ